VRHAWRPFLALCGIFILIGGPRHPGGTMAEMLAHPDWVPSHGFQLVGYVSLVIAILLYGRAGALPRRTRRWSGIALAGAVLQVVETAFHTAAVLDAENLVAGAATPVLTIHLRLTPVIYPLFAITTTGLIVAGARDRALGSWWIAWLGIAGVVAQGAAGLFVAGFGLDQLRILFPGIALFALWTVLAALWPARRAAAPVPAAL
jgi:hypothetical protein